MKKFILSLLILNLSFALFSQNSTKYEKFLKENRFYTGWHSFEFRDNGEYSWSGPNDPNRGTYSVSGNKVTINKYYSPEDPEKRYYDKLYLYDDTKITLPMTFEICPDEENLFYKGCIKNGDIIIWSSCEEYLEGIFEYNGQEVKKYPVGDKEIYLYVLENTRMRDAPSIHANVVKLGYLPSHHNKYVEERSVIYAGEIIRIYGATPFEEEIGGVKAKWYLICEDDKTEGPDSEAKFVWVFGGWVKEISRLELSAYKEKSKELLKQSEPGW